MENKILSLFTRNEKLKFNQIESLIGERSNKVAYHLSNLTKKGLISKKDEFYALSDSSEYLVPYLSEKQSVIPVVLVMLEKNKKFFLVKRSKRPYKDLLGLPGGRITLGESIQDSARRIMKEKHNINISAVKTLSISLEHLKKSNKIIHSYLIILVKANASEKLEYFSLQKSKNMIIKSDYKLITSKQKECKISTIISKI